MQRHSTRFKRAAGFTLMELLVALVILGMLAGIVGPRIMKYVGGAKSDTAKVQIEDLVNALHMYQLDVGSYPSQEADCWRWWRSRSAWSGGTART
ncbi:MAG: type II secretion system protein GspG, partial [Pseudomonadales bacterium]|nr:type II secretion system protein GspG [Pseudomonadales bacterium]